MKLSLNAQILVGATLGLLVGWCISVFDQSHALVKPTIYVLDLTGQLFVDLLKMILIPLVFASISVGIANLRAHARMQKVWKLTLLYFISTSALAVLLGLIVVNIFKPGVGLELTLFESSMSTFSASDVSLAEFVKMFLSNLFMNPFSAMAQGKVLPTVIFSILLGIGIVVSGKRAEDFLQLLNQFYDLIMLMVDWIMKLAPIGIFALLAKLIATQDINIIQALGKFVMVVIGSTLFHGFVTLPTLLFVFTRINPWYFFLQMREALVMAFSTSSSSATLPVTMRCLEDNLKSDKDIAGFVLPLGATINMDGTALYEAVAALFVANIMGIDLNIVQQLVVFFTAIIAAIGAPGIPSAGMVTMVMVLQSVGLPVEAIAILLPIDRLLDATRTMINVKGDAVGTMIVESLSVKRQINSSRQTSEAHA